MKGTQQYKEAKRMEREGISKRNEIGKSSPIEWNQQGRGDQSRRSICSDN